MFCLTSVCQLKAISPNGCRFNYGLVIFIITWLVSSSYKGNTFPSLTSRLILYGNVGEGGFQRNFTVLFTFLVRRRRDL